MNKKYRIKFTLVGWWECQYYDEKNRKWRQGAVFYRQCDAELWLSRMIN